MKYCSHCGTQLINEAAFCSNCGKPTDDAPAPVNPPKPRNGTGGKKRSGETGKRPRWLAAGLSVLAVLGVFAVVIVTFAASAGYKGAVKRFMKLYKNYDIESIVEMSSYTYDFMNSDYYADNYFKQAVGNDLDRFDAQIGHNFKITYEITDVYELSARQYENMLDALRGGFTGAGDVSDLIDKIKQVELSITASHGKETLTLRKTLILSREDGTWRVLYFKNAQQT